MNEEILWDIFVKSGSVADYLRYSAAKNRTDLINDNSRGNRP